MPVGSEQPTNVNIYHQKWILALIYLIEEAYITNITSLKVCGKSQFYFNLFDSEAYITNIPMLQLIFLIIIIINIAKSEKWDIYLNILVTIFT